MPWIAEHGRELFVFFLIPIMGLVLDAFVSIRKLIYILIGAGILLAPAATGYSYTFSWGYGLFSFIALSCAYALLSTEVETKKGKITAAVFGSGVLFLALGWFAFIDSFSGTQTVEKQWRTEDYKIKYIRDQGFAGGPRMIYELSKYAQIPFFIKTIETTVDTVRTQNCQVVFADSKIVFDKCKGRVKRIK